MVQEEIATLSQMAEQLNHKLAANNAEPAGGIAESVDLDNLFAFLSDVQPPPQRNNIIDEIGEQMNELVEDLDVEVKYYLQTLETLLKVQYWGLI